MCVCVGGFIFRCVCVCVCGGGGGVPHGWVINFDWGALNKFMGWGAPPHDPLLWKTLSLERILINLSAWSIKIRTFRTNR